MRVFYVRPSDNGNYGVEAALAALVRPPEQVDLALFRGFRVPLEPLNFDPAEDGFADLNGYELVILAGLDPVVLTPLEHLALVAYVERGGGLLLLGGTHSFSNAEGTYLPLDPILPVRILRNLDVEVNALPTMSAHPIARGLPSPVGYINKVHPVEPKAPAQVAMKVGELPLAVAGEYGYGRVVVLASYPECEEAEYGWFFTGDAFDDFLRNAAAWMRKEQEPIWVEGFTLASRRVATGNEEFGKVKVNAAAPTAARVATQLTAPDGRVVRETAVSVQIRKPHEALFSFRVPDDPRERGVHYLRVGVFDAGGRETARRDVAIEIANPVHAAIELEYGRRAYVPGDSARVLIRAACELANPPAELTLDVALVDAAGQPAGTPKRRVVRQREGGYEDLELGLPVPRLRPGRYRLTAELRVGDDLADAAAEEICVLGPSARDAFPLIAEGGYHLDRPTTERAIRDLAAAGVNTVSLPGPPTKRGGEPPHREQMLAFAEQAAACAGLAIAHHRRGLVPGLSPAAPLAPCPSTPEFRQALDKEAKPLLEAAARVPGLRFLEMAPQAAAAPEQLCQCTACRGAYRRNFAGELPTGDAASLDLPARRALASFVTSYWWHVYSAVQRLRDDAAPGLSLSLTLDASSFVRQAPDAPYCDAQAWARACDLVEAAPERDLARLRLSLAGHRTLMAGLGKPFGAQLDIAEGSLPPAEAAWTALAHGAASLGVAENPRFLFFRRQPLLADAVGGVFRRIAAAGPLLARAQRPQARLALLFPFTDALVRCRGGLAAASELAHAALGAVDLLHERLATAEGLASYAGIVIMETELLPRRAAAAIAAFVERGGLLLADRADFIDEDGAPIAWPDGFFGSAETPVFETVTSRRRRYGTGRTTVLSPDIVGAFARAVERGDAVAARELRRAVADAAAENGVRPRARSADPAVEVGVRIVDGVWLLVAVNHSGEARAARVELDPKAAFACAYDLASGEETPIERGDGQALALRLAPRDGGVWALYPERPFTLRLELPQAVSRRGEDLTCRVTVTNEAGRPAAGSHLLRLVLVEPDGQERPDLGGTRATTNGVLEVAQPLGVNEPVGRWTLTVTDLLTRRAVRRTFEVTDRPE